MNYGFCYIPLGKTPPKNCIRMLYYCNFYLNYFKLIQIYFFHIVYILRETYSWIQLVTIFQKLHQCQSFLFNITYEAELFVFMFVVGSRFFLKEHFIHLSRIFFKFLVFSLHVHFLTLWSNYQPNIFRQLRLMSQFFQWSLLFVDNEGLQLFYRLSMDNNHLMITWKNTIWTASWKQTAIKC